jgi:hypothetical protein
MALKKSFSSKFGTTHSNAYHRVDWLSVYAFQNQSIEFRVGIYATEAAKNANSASLEEKQFTFPYTSSIDESFVSQSYEHLKSLDEYSGSADV